MANRASVYAHDGSGQVSTTTLLNAIHHSYQTAQPYSLEVGTSVVANTWLTASHLNAAGGIGATVDPALAARAWEHARRRAEDGCIVLGSLHNSTPSVLAPFLQSFPFAVPHSLMRSLEALQPMLRCSTPFNPSLARQSALGVVLTLDFAGNLVGAAVELSQSGIDTEQGLLKITAESGYRVFDVFYYLLTSASTPAEREFLNLKDPSAYALLARSRTYAPPPYLPTADDAAAADDFRAALKDIGIKGTDHRNFISTLAGLLKLGNTLDYDADADELEEVYEDVGVLLGLEPDVLSRQCSTEERRVLVGGVYEALVDWVIGKANATIAAQMQRQQQQNPLGDTCNITVLEVPDPTLGKAICLRGVFDDTHGINAEMRDDGLDTGGSNASASVVRDMQAAVNEVSADILPTDGSLAVGSGSGAGESQALIRERQHIRERRSDVLEKVALVADQDSFLRKLLFPVEGLGIQLGQHGRLDLLALLSSSRQWYHLSLHPTDDTPASLANHGTAAASAWSAGSVSRQLRSWRLAEWANRRCKKIDYTADFDFDEFARRYAVLGCMDGRDGIAHWIIERGWSNNEVVVGRDRVWMREAAWWEVESMLDMLQPAGATTPGGASAFLGRQTAGGGAATPLTTLGGPVASSGYFPPYGGEDVNGSQDRLLLLQQNHPSQLTLGPEGPLNGAAAQQRVVAGDYGLGTKGDTYKDELLYNADGNFIETLDPELAQGRTVETQKVTLGRRLWVATTWALTFWIPSFLLRYIGRMRRPDVRMAWREKVALCIIIFLINALVVFWIILFGKLLCPNFDKAWTAAELQAHTATDNFWVAVNGRVYDITKFWRINHSNSPGIIVTSDAMLPLAGLDLSDYFPIPLTVGCQGLVTERTTAVRANQSVENGAAEHRSGFHALYPDTALADDNWYQNNFLPRMKQYYKGDLVLDPKIVKEDGRVNAHPWVVYKGEVIDLNYYLYTQSLMNGNPAYKYLDQDLTQIVQQNAGSDVTQLFQQQLDSKKGDADAYNKAVNSITCMRSVFYRGLLDFRYTPQCQLNNYILLCFTVIICAVILIKFLSSLQLGSKRRPAPQDKFVICQVPAYTEGEDSLRQAIDSLTALQYDNKRKLICLICDGVIVGQGNDRPTPKIVLDILGVDPKIDPPALAFKSVGTGGDQLNYGKVYSGLYEFEGNVVPYLVVVKVGREKEQTKSKPGNRGKRDSQILLMSFLNRVHHRSAMNPLELEMFHQINNVIGVDPELYEYLLMIDADTCVREDALNRLVAACAKDSKIAGICGETSLQNEERSWWTMIQVYEYFISHNLAKAFESLFGSVTCLPGCFTMYRLRTADKGKPLIIADAIIEEYSDCYVDTLHKKNLLSLGEDRFLTTLMTKHFPQMSYKFTADAYCQTAAPETWSVLLSQRRRWINSTIHNLVELIRLKDMCGFCCFSMRFVVFIDLFGTIILPATCVYLGWLVYRLATKTGPFPLITIILLAAVYGLQALIFIVKRQWQHVGWMIIYILAFPIYSFILPIYSFWNQDNFSWGNTRIVIGEKGDKKVVALDGDDPFDPRSVPLQRWDHYAAIHNLPGRRGPGPGGVGGYPGAEKLGDDQSPFDDAAHAYEMDDFKSVYSSVRNPSVYRGGAATPAPGGFVPQFGGVGGGVGGAMPAAHSSVYGHAMQPGARASTLSMGLGGYGGGAGAGDSMAMRQSVISLGGGGLGGGPLRSTHHSPYQSQDLARSNNNLNFNNNNNNRSSVLSLRPQSVAPALGNVGGSRMSRLGTAGASFDFQNLTVGPDDAAITEAIRVVLADVDLDSVTKKQVRVLVEHRLGTELSAERKVFMDQQIDVELANM